MIQSISLVSYLLLTILLLNTTYGIDNIQSKLDKNFYGKECPKYCQKCLSDHKTCLSCSTNYFLNSDIQCKPCNSECKDCS